jgi:hypothetical protein
MRARWDTVLASSILLTLSLLALVPHNLQYASTWHQRSFQETDRLYVQNYLMPLGFASLASVLVGLIVTWTAYRSRLRWAWFVMFVIVWVFAFPVYVLPVLLDFRTAESVSWSAWFWNAVEGPGIARDYAKGPLDFLLMVIALLLPIKSFFRKPSARERLPVPTATGRAEASACEPTERG